MLYMRCTRIRLVVLMSELSLLRTLLLFSWKTAHVPAACAWDLLLVLISYVWASFLLQVNHEFSFVVVHAASFYLNGTIVSHLTLAWVISVSTKAWRITYTMRHGWWLLLEQQISTKLRFSLGSINGIGLSKSWNWLLLNYVATCQLALRILPFSRQLRVEILTLPMYLKWFLIWRHRRRHNTTTGERPILKCLILKSCAQIVSNGTWETRLLLVLSANFLR